jgi:hypothetical protein
MDENAISEPNTGRQLRARKHLFADDGESGYIGGKRQFSKNGLATCQPRVFCLPSL